MGKKNNDKTKEIMDMIKSNNIQGLRGMMSKSRSIFDITFTDVNKITY